jgi:hypothetical protein
MALIVRPSATQLPSPVQDDEAQDRLAEPLRIEDLVADPAQEVVDVGHNPCCVWALDHAFAMEWF